MKKILFAGLLLAFSMSLKAQKNKSVIDSLEKLVVNSKDSQLVKIYNDLTWEYRLVNRDKAMQYGFKAIEQARKVNYPKGMAQAYNDLGILLFDQEKYDSAIAFYQLSGKIREQLNDGLGIAKVYNKIGIVYQKKGAFDKALENQLQALSLFTKHKNDIGISYSLNNIGILNQNLGRYDDAIKYQLQSIEIKEKLKDNYGLAGSFVNIANVYKIKGDDNKATTYYNKAITISRSIQDKEYLANALNNIGALYIKKQNYKEALAAINESLQLRKDLGDTKGQVSCMNNLGLVFHDQKQYDSSIAILQAALNIGKDAVNCLPEVNQTYLALSHSYESLNKNDEALAMFKFYASTKDSLFTDNLSQKFAELETKYETLEKEKEIQRQQYIIEKKNYWIIGIALSIVLLSLLAVSYYRRYKLKQEATMKQAVLEQQQLAASAVLKAEEKERQRIAKDLHDGVGQMMSAAKMNLSAFENELQFTSVDQKLSFERIIGLVDESCKEVRTVSHQMMPNMLLKSGLGKAVAEFLDKIDQKIIKVNLHVEGLQERLNEDVEIVLFRVLQECVNNVIKHSGASQLDIALIKDKDGISATIEDNGKGFDVQQIGDEGGIGLKNMKARIDYLNGTIDFDTAAGKGTLVAIHLPLTQTRIVEL
ncbi:sensor histidine kinase [Lacibacter sp. H375]|uniref:tetratricopeptide repeat-containing sensor histidine kinase n=1 Tax=Lacibacter sp. H375 TaxID=3133424 RepID=UPI0030BC1679